MKMEVREEGGDNPKCLFVSLFFGVIVILKCLFDCSCRDSYSQI
jgi:hypothetical protein